MIEEIRALAVLDDHYHPKEGAIERTYLRGVLLGGGTAKESPIDLELDAKYLVKFPEPVGYQYGNVVSAQGILDVDDDGLKLVNASVTYQDGKTKSGGTFYIALSKNPTFSKI